MSWNADETKAVTRRHTCLLITFKLQKYFTRTDYESNYYDAFTYQALS